MYECVGGMENAAGGPSGAHHAGGGGAGGAGGGGNSSAEENIYESVDEVRQRNLMGNIDVPGCSYVSGIYGRLDVIGHGIGRIERHLSSSCGSGIDSHYPIPASQSNTAHPFPGGYATLPSSSTTTTSLASGGSHLHHHQYYHPPASVPLVPVVPVSPLALAGPSNGGVGTASGREVLREVPPALSAVSVQWLLVNRWLPLWIASGDGGGAGASGHYYCHGTSSTASTYYHYQQQLEFPDYHCLPQHQQPQHQQLQVQQALPAATAAANQPGPSNTANNAVGSTNTGTVARRGIVEAGQAGGGESNVGTNRDRGSTPPPQQ